MKYWFSIKYNLFVFVFMHIYTHHMYNTWNTHCFCESPSHKRKQKKSLAWYNLISISIWNDLSDEWNDWNKAVENRQLNKAKRHNKMWQVKSEKQSGQNQSENKRACIHIHICTSTYEYAHTSQNKLSQLWIY